MGALVSRWKQWGGRLVRLCESSFDGPEFFRSAPENASQEKGVCYSKLVFFWKSRQGFAIQSGRRLKQRAVMPPVSFDSFPPVQLISGP